MAHELTRISNVNFTTVSETGSSVNVETTLSHDEDILLLTGYSYQINDWPMVENFSVLNPHINLSATDKFSVKTTLITLSLPY